MIGGLDEPNHVRHETDSKTILNNLRRFEAVLKGSKGIINGPKTSAEIVNRREDDATLWPLYGVSVPWEKRSR